MDSAESAAREFASTADSAEHPLESSTPQSGYLAEPHLPSPPSITRSGVEVALLASNHSPPVDLRLLEYVSDFDRNLMCPICHCPFIEPLRLSCDHTFCRHCFGRAFNAQSQETKTCPTCRTPTCHADAISVPRFLIHLIDDLVVRCPKHLSGCDTQLRRGDVQSHVDHYCEFTDVPCPSTECSLTVIRKNRTEECLHSLMSCVNCRVQLMELQLQEHRKEHCPNRTTVCSSCLETFHKSEISKHESECMAAEVKCAAARIGCTFLTSRAKAQTHEGSCALAALLPTVQAMDRCIKDQGAALQVLQRKNLELESGFAAMRTVLGELSMASERSPVDIISHSTLPEATQSATVAPNTTESPPFDSATHHLLSLHESLRQELDRVSNAVTQLDARSSMMLMSESLRVKEDLAHTNAVIGSMRVQLQWLTSARLQAQRSPSTASVTPEVDSRNAARIGSVGGPAQPVRRPSDSSKELKL